MEFILLQRQADGEETSEQFQLRYEFSLQAVSP